jgi:acetyl esterase/lipase
MRRAVWLACGLLCLQQAVAEPPVLPLWPAGAPGAGSGDETVRITEQGEHVVSNVHRPSITVYLPAKPASARTAVVVVPGGGYRELWMDHEGYNVARFLEARGIAAFVLKYRLPRAAGSTYTVEVDALGDLKRALRLVRSRAAEWSLDEHRIGVIGFSAGGNLAGLGVMNSDAGDAAAADLVERRSSRPDFAALIYPGTIAQPKLPPDTPPLFLLCGSDDRPEVVTGITQLYLAAHDLKIPTELHIYAGVGHGFGLRATNVGPVAEWPRQFVDWLVVEKLAASER